MKDNKEIERNLSQPEDRIQQFLKSFDSNEIKRVLSVFEDIIQFLKPFENDEIGKILSLSGDTIKILRKLEKNEVEKILSESGEKVYMKVLVSCDEAKEGLYMAGNSIYSLNRSHRWKEKVALYKGDKSYEGEKYNYYKNMFVPFANLDETKVPKYYFQFKFINGSKWETGFTNVIEFDKEKGSIKKENGQVIGEVKVNDLTDGLRILVLKCNYKITFNEEEDKRLLALDWKDEYI